MSLRSSLTQRFLVDAPAIWGKLPSHGDYVRFNVGSEAATDWQRWISENWRASQHHQRRTQNAARRVRDHAHSWISTSMPQAPPDMSQVPVAFVMRPGTLAFAPAHYVQGVVVSSADLIGRSYPLVIYQRVRSTWLWRQWRLRDPSAPPGSELPPGHSLLYCWARLAARIHAPELDMGQLVSGVNAVWHAHAPGWLQLLGVAPAPVSLAVARQLVEDLCPDARFDVAEGLRGVKHLPWADWPARLMRPGPELAFWQQDAQGGFVNAASQWRALWRSS